MEIGTSGVGIDYLGNCGFLINGNGQTVAIDPFDLPKNFDVKADIVLITHGHADSCSIKDIEKLVDRERKTLVVGTPDCQSKLMKLDGIEMQIVEPGDEVELDKLKIETILAYNKHKDYHKKSEGWVGYVVKIGDVVIYHAGDSDFIPEMQKLSGYGKHGNNFVALLPISGKTVMDAEQASEAASLISPDLVIPMKFSENGKDGKANAEEFVELCKGKGLKALVLEKI